MEEILIDIKRVREGCYLFLFPDGWFEIWTINLTQKPKSFLKMIGQEVMGSFELHTLQAKQQGAFLYTTRILDSYVDFMPVEPVIMPILMDD